MIVFLFGLVRAADGRLVGGAAAGARRTEALATNQRRREAALDHIDIR
jgi:hypothetical protein